MVSLAEDLKLALDRSAFAAALGMEPDPWQHDLLRSTSDRVLLNCCRQSGKSTMTGVIALHQALYYPGSLILCLAPALRQSQELFGKVLGFYRDLGRPIPAQAERKLSLELENGSRIDECCVVCRVKRGPSEFPVQRSFRWPSPSLPHTLLSWKRWRKRLSFCSAS